MDILVPSINAVALYQGSEAVFRRIAQATTAAAILDYFAEIRFGLIFKELRFEMEFEPQGRRGADVAVSRDGQSAYVEIKRFRPALEDDSPNAGIGHELVPYGNLKKSVNRIEDELAGKFMQVQDGSGIVAFWSDHATIEDVDFELAIRNMRAGGVSTLLCKRPGFVFGDGCAREGGNFPFPRSAIVEKVCAS